MNEDRARANILLIGEDQLSCRLVSFLLGEEGYNVYTANNPQAAMAVLTKREIPLVIFDTVAPSESDVRLSQEIKRLHSGLPVVILVNDGEGMESLLASQYIDDYLVKPFSYTELVARVRAGLRRARRDAAPDRVVVKAEGLELDVSALTVSLPNGKKAFLSPTEMKVLHCLMARPGKIVTRAKLTESVWGPGCGEDSYIRVCISRVRRKLGNYNGVGYIEAVRGAGYRLNVSEPSSTP